jgi:serine phosphatase RsbU (regulator of sigma subunit)
LKSFLIIATLLSFVHVYGQDAQIDSLRNVVDTAVEDTIKLKALYAWDNLIYISDPEMDTELNLQMAEICESNLRKGSELTEEEIYFYKDYLTNAYNVLGINQDDQGNFPEALDYYYKATWLAEEIEDFGTVSSIQNNIGLIHEKLGDLDLATKFYRKSYNGVVKSENYSGQVNALNNIGSVKLAINELDSSLWYYRSALALAEENGSNFDYTSTLANVGVAYERLEMKDSALYYYYLAKPRFEESGDWDGLSNLYYNIGTIYIEWGQGEKAVDFCREGYRIAEKNEAEFRIGLNCSCLFDGYTILGQADSALKYYILSDSSQYRLNNLESAKLVAQKELAYEHKKVMFEDSLQHADQLGLKDAQSAKDKAEGKFKITLLLAGLGVLVILAGFIFSRFRSEKKQKNAIEEQERITRNQKEVIAHQKDEIEQSINYAQLIQQATLPVKQMSDIFNESFLMYLPKDVVSGDFYWLEEDGDKAYFSVADCTGHGIPGAFISMIGTILLNEIYNSKQMRSPEKILDELNRLIQMTLLSHNREMKDGMDMSFCCLDKKSNELDFAGANNPVWIVSKSKTLGVDNGAGFEIIEPNNSNESYNLFELKADKQPVGKYHAVQQPFTLKKARLSKGDAVYLFSDGYPDQFGGPNWKKFKYKPFKKMFLSQHDSTMSNQLKHITKVFEDWKGDVEQIDDVCVIGVKV